MSSKLQLDVCHLNWWWRHLVNAYEVKAGMVCLQVKLCDPCLRALNWFVCHARRCTSAPLYTFYLISLFCPSSLSWLPVMFAYYSSFWCVVFIIKCSYLVMHLGFCWFILTILWCLSVLFLLLSFQCYMIFQCDIILSHNCSKFTVSTEKWAANSSY